MNFPSQTVNHPDLHTAVIHLINFTIFFKFKWTLIEKKVFVKMYALIH